MRYSSSSYKFFLSLIVKIPNESKKHFRSSQSSYDHLRCCSKLSVTSNNTWPLQIEWHIIMNSVNGHSKILRSNKYDHFLDLFLIESVCPSSPNYIKIFPHLESKLLF